MAHFAELDINNQVLRVIVLNNSVIATPTGEESEILGQQFCHQLFGGHKWLQTSYNGKFRKNYAGQNFVYDTERDAFIAPKPYASWILDENTCQWQAPVPYPRDSYQYTWNEENSTWEKL